MTHVHHFLTQQGWSPAAAVPFPADWSARRYARVTRADPPYRAVLMQTEPNADFLAFIRVAEILVSLGARAPQIYAVEKAQGLLLLEDFGDANCGRLLDGGAPALPLLRRAVDALCQVQRASLTHSVPDLPCFDAQRFIALLTPLMDNFAYADAKGAAQALQEVWQRALEPVVQLPQALLLRDFIPDNLMLLPPDGTVVGLLDFELAGIGPIAYDLASLLEQVRRDLDEATRDAVLSAYLMAWPELDATALRSAVRLLTVQRHARTFARLKKMTKPDFYIRTYSFLQQSLQHPDCTALRGWFTTYLPQYFS
ncbi:MAG: phosphotransferase [Alphaproteobacteria bacterium]|nr:phosphotransferase [Alphaproteobacteria bacterium]